MFREAVMHVSYASPSCVLTALLSYMGEGGLPHHLAGASTWPIVTRCEMQALVWKLEFPRSI